VKVGIMFANVGPFGTPEHLVPFVETAEEVGIESLWTVEHVVVPKGYESAYPYSQDGKMPGPEESPIPDPLTWLPYVAAITTKLKLGTGVLILPQRHPFYVAKSMATLDQLSQGRALLGVGIGWLEEEFRGLGIPYKERVGRTEESIQALRTLWSDGPSEFHGKYYDWNPVESYPKPVQRPGIPVIVGGHAPGAARRAARYGDGFFPARSDDLAGLLDVMRKECAEIGRDPGEVEITAGSLPTLDEARRLQDLGVSRFIAPLPGFDKDSVRAGLEKLAGDLLAKL